MNSTQTATTDGFGRSVQITNGRFVATMMTGLLPVADMVSRIQLLAPFEQALEQTHKPKDRSLYSAGAMFRQRVFAHICGFEDLRIWLTTTSSQKTKAFFPHSGLMMLQAAQPSADLKTQ